MIGGSLTPSRLANSSLREEVSNQKPTMMCWAIRYPILRGSGKVGEMKLRDGLHLVHQLVWRGCVGAGLDKNIGGCCGDMPEWAEIGERARGLWMERILVAEGKRPETTSSSQKKTAPAHRYR